MTGKTGPPGPTRRYSRREWRGVSFATVERVVRYFGEQVDVGHIQVVRWPVRRRR